MCSPGRASALTGLMPSGHGVQNWLDDRLATQWPANWSAIDEFSNLPTLLKEAGYTTGLSGKYHLGHSDKPKNGFDFWVSLDRGHTANFYNNTITDNGETKVVPEHSVDYFAKRARDFILDKQASDDPFFLFVAPNGPYGHWPAIKGPCGTRHQSRYENMEITSVPREGLTQSTIDHYVLIKSDTKKGGPDRGSLLRLPNDVNALRNYFSQISVVDDLVGTVIDATEAAGCAENTLIVYTADHGFSLGHHGFWGHAIETWPANAHRCAYNVPLLVKWPEKVPAGFKSDHLVGGADLYASLLEAAGIDPLKEPVPISSRSVIPLFEYESASWDDVIFIDQEETRAIRTPYWLYVKRFATEEFPELTDELYYLPDDPDERQNLAASPDHQETIVKLSAQLEEFFAQAANREYDLWSGGTVKSNTSRPWLWPRVWGNDWKPACV